MPHACTNLIIKSPYTVTFHFCNSNPVYTAVRAASSDETKPNS